MYYIKLKRSHPNTTLISSEFSNDGIFHNYRSAYKELLIANNILN